MHPVIIIRANVIKLRGKSFVVMEKKYRELVAIIKGPANAMKVIFGFFCWAILSVSNGEIFARSDKEKKLETSVPITAINTLSKNQSDENFNVSIVGLS